MPKIPYFLLFGGNDTLITEKHYPPLYKAMEEHGHSVKVHIEEGMGHCETLNFEKALNAYCAFIAGE